ncbi:MAG TPA: hypothetical protein VJ481_00020 [Patescibacteria group bacterium]|uniref:RanBP2-type domain-containing protein n=1 Tax=Candidatus Woesebacteria bacterium RBG_13_46_13 TaxID=1802479 RepID=A0A1F7X412_9BACT|nr:MAG: hypothetical protein A2Y68_03820 [Candidatus Woesebacteria bacterium RBG_13_46_13]HJX58928.1 hypothetical protein [Patescibacteria group bacterium]
MAKREGRWDCRSCGTKGVRGRFKYCSQCGSPRPANVKFYLPEGEPEVTDPKLLALAGAGPDWTCEHCSQDNVGTSAFCGQCGAKKDGSPSRKTKTYGLGSIPRSGDEFPEEEKPASAVYSQETSTPKGSLFSKLKIPAAICAGAAFLGLLGFLLFARHDVPLTVSGFAWERTVTVEEYRTVVEEDWSIPAGGRYQSEGQAIHHYDSVEVGSHQEPYQDCHQEVSGSHQECSQEVTGYDSYVCGSSDDGNGFFSDVYCDRPEYSTVCDSVTDYSTVCDTLYRTVTDYEQVPVYATRYTYEIERWVFDRTEVSQGSDHTAFWPPFTLEDNERESGRNEAYEVLFVDDEEKTYSYTVDLAAWQIFEVGQNYTGKVNTLGVLTEVSDE